ncbi:MAG: S1 family peptidase [Pseudomonadota bacterium]
MNRWAFRLAAGLALASGLHLAGHAQQTENGLVALIPQVKRAIVSIATYDPLRQPQVVPLGTGFVVADGRHAVTNMHVVDASAALAAGAAKLVALAGSGAAPDIRMATLVASDPDHDLALLGLEGEPLPPLPLRQGETPVAEGTAIAITGFPIAPVLGLYPATHKGIVAAIAPNATPQGRASQLENVLLLRSRFDVYQLDIVAYPGNSGSPVYDIASGEAIAVVNSTFVKDTREIGISNPSGISYAIPIKFVNQMLRSARLAR